MKIVIVGLLCLLFIRVAVAQQDLLSFDEHNKYIYYQVENMPGVPADSLKERGLYFVKTLYPKAALGQASPGGLEGEGKFITYGHISAMKREKGEIAYQLNIEFKDQKYRFWLTGFIFTPYRRDRHGNYTPQQGLDVPLEDALTKFDKKEANDYLDKTGAFCKQWGERLKIYMLKAHEAKKEERPKQVVTDKW
jgi:hypothetical protein